jgi:uncharacterized protein YndB with AHSA1/START domain
MSTGKILNKSIHIDSPIGKVWNALTDPDIIKQWLFGTNVITDWKVGSPILFTGTWQGVEYQDKGNILQIEPGKIFQYNYWSGFSGLPNIPENYTVVTFKLEPVTDGTELNLTQSNFPTEEGYEHSDKNWDMTLDLLKKTIEE